MSWVVTPEWFGEVCFVLGCGPSLTSYRLPSLRRLGRFIATNDSFLLAPWADVLYFHDYKFWERNSRSVQNMFTGRYIVTMEKSIEGVKQLRNTGATGLETDPGGLRHGSNSGYQAINLAYHFGANRIVLLGFDMRVSGGRLHWKQRSEEPTEFGFQKTINEAMLPKFSSLSEPLLSAGVVVVNSTPGSALKTWPYAPIEEVISLIDNKDFWKRKACSTVVTVPALA